MTRGFRGLGAAGINFLDMTGDNIVTAGSDGYVRFYDFKIRMVAWFDYFDNGSVMSVDFCRTGKQVHLYPRPTRTATPPRGDKGDAWLISDV